MSVIHNEATDRLFETMLRLESVEECYGLFEDLCTIKELQDMAQRLEVATLLDEGMKYQEVAGYRRAIEKRKKAEQQA